MRGLFPAVSKLALALVITLYPTGAMAAEQAGSHGSIVSEEWMDIMFNRQKVGFSYLKIEKGKDGYRMTNRAVIRMSLMGIEQDMSFSQVSYLDGNKELLRYEYLQTLMNQRQKTSGVIKGDKLYMTITGAGGTSSQTVKIPRGTRFAESIEFSLADKLRTGFKQTFPIFITSLRTVANLKIEVVGKKRVKWKGQPLETFIVESTLQGVKTKSYVTTDGIKVMEESLMGLTSVKVSEDEALKFTKAHVPITSLITFSLITPDKPITRPEDFTVALFEISGLDRPDLMPADERQSPGTPVRVFDETRKRYFTVPITIRKVTPDTGKVTIKQAGADQPDELKPTPEIQSDNNMIKNQAQKIIGSETDAWKAAVKLNRWVYKSIEKKFVDSFTAVDVLVSKQGECQSHSNLYTALARSVGIPARIASGLVYSRMNKGFLYHAWPEVYVGKWIAVDPTLGQDVADITHIKLAEGGVENQIKLVRYIGKIAISVKSLK